MRAGVLIVEDDEDELEVALRALRRADLGAPIEVARDGQQALECLGIEAPAESPPLRPRVVFLDLKMPRVDGWEVLSRVRADPATADLPVVVVSSSDEAEDIRRCYAMGANSFLVKRYDPSSPGAYLVEAARYWIQLNRPAPEGIATDE
jgi:CheY-like chemotaxis protein